MLAGKIYRHIFRLVLHGNIVCAACVIMVMGLVLLAMTAQLLDRNAASTVDYLLVVTLQMPQIFIECLPAVATCGAALAYAQSSRAGELQIFRASGLSAWQFLRPTIFYAVCLSIVTVFIFRPFAVVSSIQYGRVVDRLLLAESDSRRTKNIWFHYQFEGENTMIRGVLGGPFSNRLDHVNFFFFTPGDEQNAPQLLRRIDGESARLDPGKWRIQEALISTPANERIGPENTSIPTDLAPNILHTLGVAVGHINFWDFPRYIAGLRSAGHNTDRYVYTFHALLALPFLLVGMSLIGATNCFRMPRSGGLVRMAYISIGSAVAVLYISQLTLAFSTRGLIPPVLGAWCPSLFCFFSALAAVSFMEDG